jgi:hypothetical protein
VECLSTDGAFQGGGGLVVHFLQEGVETTGREVLVELIICSQVLGIRAIAHGLSEDSIDIIIIYSMRIYL